MTWSKEGGAGAVFKDCCPCTLFLRSKREDSAEFEQESAFVITTSETGGKDNIKGDFSRHVCSVSNTLYDTFNKNL
jgi:hypothetical protein